MNRNKQRQNIKLKKSNKKNTTKKTQTIMKELGMKVKSKGTWMPSPQQESSIPRQRVTESFEKVVK